ncbi:MAG: hypothetical protein SF053_06335 [Bacteroidia bacterium]|nr:hypothetical protein [Bacteroidia bacterium]
MTKYFFLIWVAVGCHTLLGQQQLRVDTIMTDARTAHLFLRIEAPAGELHMHSSGACGVHVTRHEPTCQVQSGKVWSDNRGNQYRDVYVRATHSPAAAATMPVNQIARLNPYAQAGESQRMEYNPDPSIPTDIRLNLGTGASRLDFSDLTLHRVEVNAAFSDVMLLYSMPNRDTMESLTLHAGKGDISLKQLELSLAEMVMVQNDLGNTQIQLGNRSTLPHKLFLRSGAGQNTLIIHPSHPVQLIVEAGFFVSVEIPTSFKETTPGVYVNRAAILNPAQATRIICNLDFGGLTVMENSY